MSVLGDRNVPNASEPFLRDASPDADVSIFSGSIGVHDGGALNFQGDGHVWFRWLPRPSLLFAVAKSGAPLVCDLDEVFLVAPELSDSQLKGLVTSTTVSINPLSCGISGTIPDGIATNGHEATLSELSFDVPNYHNFIGDVVVRGRGTCVGA
jgi:hypothetical protein